MSTPRYTLGINTCFAVKRWPEPGRWAEIVAETLGLGMVQHSLDLVDLDADAPLRPQAEAVAAACAAHGIALHSTFTGLGAYGRNLLLDPDPIQRRRAAALFRRAVDFTAAAGGRATGGHIGAFSVADWRDDVRRDALWSGLRANLRELAGYAGERGLDAFLFENMAARREPSTIAEAESLLASAGNGRAAIALCLDVGHQCVVGTSGDDRDPYAWLGQLGARSPVVHLQQSDAEADQHWPFTAERNAQGRIDAGRVLAALDASGAGEVALVLEVIPSFEQDDDLVLVELAESAEHWRAALAARGEARRSSGSYGAAHHMPDP
jgi:D-erythrulose 1-phosphate 3-epimerase